MCWSACDAHILCVLRGKLVYATHASTIYSTLQVYMYMYMYTCVCVCVCVCGMV